ncbi:hypothetical protein OESDEN_20633 [Oesophagostomum dentatum]|uniref:Helicase C-terminal domain-containing protein n=1 Tax=Oesophagostomum dentatum TaxID=61180 RepID=A0A0B1S878_OESDE|nr:hypothetical protein OESDEN_20633 [Oesophagostomum dentatum]
MKSVTNARFPTVVLLSGKALLNTLDQLIDSEDHPATNKPSTSDKSSLAHIRHINMTISRDEAEILYEQKLGHSNQLTVDSKKFEILRDLYPKLRDKKSIIVCGEEKKALWLCELMQRQDLPVTCVASKPSLHKSEFKKFDSASSGVVLISAKMAVHFKDKQIPVMVNFDLPTKAKRYRNIVECSGVAPENRTVINLLGTKKEESMMQTARLQYGITVEEVSSLADVTV